jgi:hypothetical protein
MKFASVFKRLGFDSQDGELKVNLYFDKIDEKTEGVAGQTAIFFRYYDENNYYVIKMNNPEKKIIELHKKVMGNEYLIDQVPDVTEFGVWYQYFIVFYKNEIKVAREIGKIRKLEMLFDLKDDSVQRGTVALGTNGDALNTYFDQFECVPFEPQVGIINTKVEQHREYGECMFPKNVAQRQSFFEKRYHTHEKAKLYCF